MLALVVPPELQATRIVPAPARQQQQQSAQTVSMTPLLCTIAAAAAVITHHMHREQLVKIGMLSTMQFGCVQIQMIWNTVSTSAACVVSTVSFMTRSGFSVLLQRPPQKSQEVANWAPVMRNDVSGC
jgi:hypothetical protein